MKRNGLLIVVLAALAAANGWVGRSASLPNYQVMPDMVYSPAAVSFSASTILPEGHTMQPLPEHVVSRGHLPIRASTEAQPDRPAGADLINPWSPDDPMALKRGEHVYGQFCVPCHGPAGRGDGVVAQRGFPPPPSLLQEKTVQLKDGQMFHVVTFGQKNMPSHARQIEASDRWKAVLHVRALQKKAETPAGIVP